MYTMCFVSGYANIVTHNVEHICSTQKVKEHMPYI